MYMSTCIGYEKAVLEYVKIQFTRAEWTGLVIACKPNNKDSPHTIRLTNNKAQSAQFWHTLNLSTDHKTWIHLK